MGNNQAFMSFEASVIAVYNQGVLDRDLLAALAAPYAKSDIDHGGMAGTLTKDGMDIDDIMFKLYGVELPPRPAAPDKWVKCTKEQRAELVDWEELLYEKRCAIEKEWGWY